MDDAVLDLCFGKHCLNGRSKTGQVIGASYEDILYPTVAQAIENSGPELGALGFSYPHSKHFFSSLQIDAYGYIDSLFDYLALGSDKWIAFGNTTA